MKNIQSIKELRLLYNTRKKEYMADNKLNITLERIYLKHKLEDYKGDTVTNYINILIVIITTILTILIENSISEASNYVIGLI